MDISNKTPLLRREVVLEPRSQTHAQGLVLPDENTSGYQQQPVNSASYSGNMFQGYPHKESTSVSSSTSLSKQAWDEELDHAQHMPWNTSVLGRGGVRLITRGVIGVTCFTLANVYIRKTMDSKQFGYRPGEAPTQPLHYVADAIDRYISRPLEHIVTAMGGDGKQFVTFRPTRFHYGSTGGSTLGHEVVKLASDFSAMSIGDSAGRDIAAALDPNSHHNWIDKDGHLDYKQMGKNVAKNTWKYVSLSAGEDWVVSLLGYAFITRGIRDGIEKMSPGFGYDHDRRLNGGSYKVDTSGKIIGTYGLEGALDLQARFTAYNVGTLMYREAYAHTGHALKNWYESGFKLPHALPSLGDALQSTTKALGDVSRWAMRDTIKATLYMTPAMPAFWLFRTPQHKYRGVFINPELGMIGYQTGNDIMKLEAVHVNELHGTRNKSRPDAEKFTPDTPTFFSHSDAENKSYNRTPVENPYKIYSKPNEHGQLKIDAYEHTYGMFDKLTNPLGYLNNTIRKKFHIPIEYVHEKYDLDLNSPKIRAKNFTDTLVNASFSYTPYFFMKNDVMTYNWDSAKMDMAITRMIDGALSLKGSEITEGIGEIWAAMRAKPFADPAREVAAQKAICNDKSPPDGHSFVANARCVDEALHDITTHSKYHENLDTKRYVERIDDSRKRSQKMLDGLLEESTHKFTDTVQPRSRDEAAWQSRDPDASYRDRELQRKIRSISDFPEINTTLH